MVIGLHEICEIMYRVYKLTLYSYWHCYPDPAVRNIANGFHPVEILLSRFLKEKQIRMQTSMSAAQSGAQSRFPRDADGLGSFLINSFLV